jgi:hypothetical protein
VAGVITDQLRLYMGLASPRPSPPVTRDEVVAAEIGQKITDELVSNTETIDALRVLIGGDLAKSEERLTSEQAAERMGFSRSYANALFDSDDFKGKVMRSEGGHRCVLATAVDEWKEARGVNYPLSKEDEELLSAPVPSEFFEAIVSSQPESSAKMRESLANRERSRNSRPRRK